MAAWRFTLDTTQSQPVMEDGDYRQSFAAVFSATVPGATDAQGASHDSMPAQPIQGHWDDSGLGGTLGWQPGDEPELDFGDTVGSDFDPFSPKADPMDVENGASLTLGRLATEDYSTTVFMLVSYQTTQVPNQQYVGLMADVWTWCQYS